jgi:small subunit ribosomal protein S18
MQKKGKFVRKLRPVPTNCIFCSGKTQPEYKDVSVLTKYLTERGKLMGRSRTGVCATHQRALGNAVKRARYVALLPYVVRA